MSKRDDKNLLGGLDWMIFSIYLSLVGVGWLMIYTVGYDEDNTAGILNLSTNIGKQTFFIGISLVILLFTWIIDWKFWRTFAYLIYAIGMLKLLGVLIFGITVKGATSWYSIGGFTYQPSEFAKFATCLAMAAFLSTYNTNIKHRASLITAVSLFVAPMFFVLLQPDAGSALVFLSFLFVLYRAGLSVNFYIVGFVTTALFILGLVFPAEIVVTGLLQLVGLVLIFNFKQKRFWLIGTGLLIVASVVGIKYGYIIPVFAANFIGLLGIMYMLYRSRRGRLVSQVSALLVIGSVVTFSASYFFNNVLESHQQDRINVWLRPSICDPQGALYNVLQSKMSIGSGGFKGKGFLQGNMTKLNYVPEQSTDFIFCTIGEEQGFIGSLSIIALFLLLILRIVSIAERQRSEFSRYYAYGVAGVIFIHVFINIGMTMGLVPIIGIPLPFISYGGSSMLGFTIMIGVLLRLDSKRLLS